MTRKSAQQPGSRLLLLGFTTAFSWLALATLLPAQGRRGQDLKEQRMAQFDKNSDGRITEDEAGADLWKRLSLFDANGDGVLEGQELDRLGGGAARRPVQTARPGGAPQSFEVASFKASNGQSIDYSLFVPKSLKEGEKLPLVLCLHGSGGSTMAAKVLAARERQAEHPCLILAPGCDSSQGRWVSTGSGDVLERRSVETELTEALQHVIASQPVDPDRVYITGQSMGGAGTWGMALNHTELFAAAVPVCGYGDVDQAAKLVDLPLWVFHGAKDERVPVEASRRMVAALKDAGASPKYTEFPDAGHNSWDPAYDMDELWAWLFEQRRQPEKDRADR